MDLKNNNTSKDSKIAEANVTWEKDSPRSIRFNDIYFSPEDGLAESQYVFLENNQLDERWNSLETDESFTIAETGFGTGLNFLAACSLWNTVFKQELKNQQLHFISFENYPLTKKELSKAHGAFPQLETLSKELVDVYPKLISGIHRLHLKNNIHLTLIFDNAIEALDDIETKIDAWFFDGFSPNENPELWSDLLFNKTKKLNKIGTSFSTFTSAGHVKRKLQGIGFEIKKVKGFGNKREMLTGKVIKNESQAEIIAGNLYKYQESPWLIKKNESSLIKNQSVAIIGSGLAGAWTAYKLATKGFQVKVIDSEADIATGASGNPRGATYFKLNVERDLQSDFYLFSYLYATSQLNNLALKNIIPSDKSVWNACGIMQLAFDDEQKERIKALENKSEYKDLFKKLNKRGASELSNTILNCPALYFKDGGSVDPQALCKKLLNHKNISVQLNTKIASITQEETLNQWRLIDSKGNTVNSSNILILANSYSANTFNQSNTLPLFKVRGQSTQITSNTSSKKLSTVICSKGYLTPENNDEHTIGSTFDPRNSNTDVNDKDNNINLDYLNTYTPAFYQGLCKENESTPTISGAKAALRCQTPDNLPMLGQVINNKQFQIDYSDIAKGKLKKLYPATSYHPNLYINTGHGSRGLISTPFCAEILVNEILNETPACGLAMQRALSPTRFNLRSLKKS